METEVARGEEDSKREKASVKAVLKAFRVVLFGLLSPKCTTWQHEMLMELPSSPQPREALTGKAPKVVMVVGVYMYFYIHVCKFKGLVWDWPWGHIMRAFTQHSSEEFIHIFTSTHVHTDAQTYKQWFRLLNLGMNSHQHRTPGFHMRSSYLQARICASWQIARQWYNVQRWRGYMTGRGVKKMKKSSSRPSRFPPSWHFLSCLLTVVKVHSGPVTTHISYQNRLFRHAKRSSLHMSFGQGLYPDIRCKKAHIFSCYSGNINSVFWAKNLTIIVQERALRNNSV